MKIVSLLAVLVCAVPVSGQWKPYQKKAPCVCGTACACPVGDCPTKCPVTSGTVQLPPAPAGFEWRRDQTEFGWGLFQVGLPQVASSRPVTLPQTSTFRFAPQSCPNGQCPLPQRR